MNRTGWIHASRAVALTAVLAVLAVMPARAQEAQQQQQQAQLPEVFDLVPAQAHVVIVVPDLTRLSNNLAMLNNALNLGVPTLGDALGEFKRNTGMNRGINDQGALALGVMNAFEGNAEQPPMMLFVPVANYDEFLGNFESQIENNIAQITMQDGHVAFSRQVGTHALLSPRRELVANYQPAQSRAALSQLAGAQGAAHLNRGDVGIFVNIDAMRPQLTTMLQSALAQGRAAVGDGGAPGQATAAAIMEFYGNILSAAVRDTNSFVTSMDIQDLGLGIGSAVQLKPKSPTASFITSSNGAAAVTSRLPDRPFVFASSTSLEGVALDRIVDALEAELKKPGMEFLAQVVRPTLPMLRRTRSIGQAYYVPQQMAMGGGMFNSVSVIETNDADAFVNDYRSYVNALQQVSIDLGPMPGPDGRVDPNMPPAVMTFNTSYNENALQVDGVRVDQYQVSTNLPPQLMAQMGDAAGMIMMMGGMQQSGYIASKDQFVVLTSTTDAQMIRAGLAALNEDAGLNQQQTIAQVRQFLPENTSIESFVSVSGIGEMANQTMQAFGQQPMIQVPANLPPIGFGAAFSDSGISSRTFVPMPVMNFLADTGRQFGGMMQPQQQPMENNNPPF